MVKGKGAEIMGLFGCGGDNYVLRCERLVAPDAEEVCVVVDGIECGFNGEMFICDGKGLDTVQCEVLQYAFFCLHSQYVPTVLESHCGILGKILIRKQFPTD